MASTVMGGRTEDVAPPCWRLCLGFIVGPAVAALLFSLVSPLSPDSIGPLRQVVGTTVLVLIVVYPMTLVLAVPTYLALKSRLRPTAINCALVGAGIAALPWAVLSLVTPTEERIGTVVTVHAGVRTAAGWLQELQLLGGIALLGAVAGFVFWCAVALGSAASAREG